MQHLRHRGERLRLLCRCGAAAGGATSRGRRRCHEAGAAPDPAAMKRVLLPAVPQVEDGDAAMKQSLLPATLH